MSRRKLPDAAYDFWAVDSRDGERRPIRDTLAEAKADAAKWRNGLSSWNRCCISVDWQVNEGKVSRIVRCLRDALTWMDAGGPSEHGNVDPREVERRRIIAAGWAALEGR